MKLGKNILAAASLLALISKHGFVIAQEANQEWVPRNIDQVTAELEYDSNNQVTYTVQYGDTLSVIAQAMKIDTYYLAQLNHIDNMDLIYAGNVLTAQLDANQAATSLTIESPRGDVVEVDIPVNLSPSFNTANDNAVASTAPVVVTPASAPEATVPAENLSPAVTTLGESSSASAPEVNDTINVVAPGPKVGGGNSGVEEVPPTTMVPDAVVSPELTPDKETTKSDIIVDNTSSTREEERQTSDITNGEGTLPPTSSEDTSTEDNSDDTSTVTPEAPADTVTPETPTTAPTTDPSANPENAGLQSNVAAYKEEVAGAFGVTDFSTYRPGDPGDHGKGLAVDFMVYDNKALGDQIAEYSIQNMAQNNISYVIWQQQIYGDWSQTWTPMEDRGSDTANHKDHVHVSFNP